jgi:phosphoribosylformylglycinamidine cyclo-ligase
MKLQVTDTFPGDTKTVAEVLLSIHRSYLAALRPMLGTVHAMAHITGGGLPLNVNRAMPSTLDAVVDTRTWQIPNAFQQLEQAGGVDRLEMFRTFNMGIGMVVVAAQRDAAAIVERVQTQGINAWRLGEVRPGTGQVILA